MGGAIGGAFSAIGGIAQANATRSAAKKQADAVKDAQQMSIEAAEKARSEILDRMNPALQTYRQEINRNIDTIRMGEIDIMDVLQRATGQANQILSQSGSDAMRAIMGSRASSQGMPIQQFDRVYSQGGPQAVAQATGGRVTLPQQQPQTIGGRTTAQLPEYDARRRYEEIMAEGPTMEEVSGGLRQARDEQGNLLWDTKSIGGIGGTSFKVPRMEEYTVEQAKEGWEADRQARAEEALRGYWQPEIGEAQQLGQIGLGPTPQAPTTPGLEGVGFAGAQEKLEQGLAGGLASMRGQTDIARGDIEAGREAALGSIAGAKEESLARYQPYSEAGQAAIQREAALSGALGAEAQQEAIDSFIESPGQKYLREQQEKALLRSAAATGGLGGGRVLSALQEQAMGRAAGQQQQYLENLRSLAGRGQQVAGAEAGIIGGAGQQQAQIQQQAAANLSNLAQQLGMREADLMRMSASEQAALAERTGLNIAQIQQTIQGAQAANVAGLGSGLAQIRGGTLADIIAQQSGLASAELTGQQNIAQILANLATQQGTNLANLQVAGGAAQAAGTYGAGQSIGQTFQNLGEMIANYQGQQQAQQPTTQQPAVQTQQQPTQQTITTQQQPSVWSI